jgi:hypothetical protein
MRNVKLKIESHVKSCKKKHKRLFSEKRSGKGGGIEVGLMDFGLVEAQEGRILYL